MFSLEHLRIFTEPQQGATYDDLLAVAQRAEELGFGAFFRSDHYLAMGGALEAGGLPGPTDAWTTLAGLARDTSTIRLGTLVTSATFRLPGPLAITVAGVDQMSGGRVELGLGAGWYEREHQAYGIPFPPLGERFDRLEEQLAIITGLWSTPAGEPFSLRRRALPGHRLTGAAQAGAGRRRPDHRRRRRAEAHAALAARFAAEFNAPFVSIERFVEQRERVDRGVRGDRTATRRRSRSRRRSVVCVGADDAEVERRAAAIGREPDELRGNGVAGTPDEVARHARALGRRRRRAPLPAGARPRRPRPPRRHRRRRRWSER